MHTAQLIQISGLPPASNVQFVGLQGQLLRVDTAAGDMAMIDTPHVPAGGSGAIGFSFVASGPVHTFINLQASVVGQGVTANDAAPALQVTPETPPCSARRISRGPCT